MSAGLERWVEAKFFSKLWWPSPLFGSTTVAMTKARVGECEPTKLFHSSSSACFHWMLRSLMCCDEWTIKMNNGESILKWTKFFFVISTNGILNSTRERSLNPSEKKVRAAELSSAWNWVFFFGLVRAIASHSSVSTVKARERWKFT